MKEGVYTFFVERFSGNGNNQYGFKAEIEMNGELFPMEYSTGLKYKEQIIIGKVLYKNGEFKLLESLESTGSIKTTEHWGVKLGDFDPVVAVTKSPNFWETTGNNKGNEHLFLFLKNCRPEEKLNGFYNEFLRSDLNSYKNFFAAIGSSVTIGEEEGLSGVGFSKTKNKTFIIRINGKQIKEVKVGF